MRFNRVLWLAFSVSLVVLGVVCIANPLDTMRFLAYLVGFIMLFSGIGEIVYFIQMRYVMILLDVIVSCVFGVVLLFGGEDIAQNFIPLFIALWLILKGVLWFIHAWRVSYVVSANTKMSIIIMGGLYVVLGILFILFPEVLATLISLALGIMLIISGGVGLYFWNLARRID
ncbi:DUF308 domain-containing protein [uncultured Helicobacter sp.]|uniref:DUF308 domain-containing protein n=1 Tax=uncultured Helicobacter sp. TaxID=175537 RepID=UPI00262A132B|nr:DUF308 domain-containing protein [uncultured Helicobacter sp.]